MKCERMIFAWLIVLLSAVCAPADPGDTTTVVTFNQEFVNWADAHVARFAFPAEGPKYSQVLLHVVIGCPSAPGDCDPWDRLGDIAVRVPTGDSTYERVEIARFVTPYDITGSGGPGTCPWDYDVTAYQTLFHDSVTMALTITSWIGGNRGWLITATFTMIEGQPDPEPYRVVPLWNLGYLVYGDPERPPENYIAGVPVQTNAFTESILIRVTCTGHGQGNTNNAAEFSNKWHRVWADGDNFQHDLWRDDCGSNPCSPQLGTWPYNRAGWCPGASVPPWDNFYTNFTPGNVVEFWYDIEPYENFCRPTNPNCVSGQTCQDCNYNYTGHTEPNYALSGAAILYREPLATPEHSAPVACAMSLEQNAPNPFNARTTIRFSLTSPGDTKLIVRDLTGREIARLVSGAMPAGSHEIAFDAAALTSGVYFYSLIQGRQQLTRKLLLVK